MSVVDQTFLQSSLDFFVSNAGVIFAAILGGCFAIAGAFFASVFEHRNQNKIRAEERRKRDAERAFKGVMKLLASYNSIANLKLEFDEMFEAFKGDAGDDLEPWGVIKPVVGFNAHVEFVSVEEMAFLPAINQTALISEIALAEKRVKNLLTSAEVIFKLKRDLNEYLLANAEETEIVNGTRIASGLNPKDVPSAHMKMAQIHSVLAALLEYLDADIAELKRCTRALNDAAIEHFGKDYPQIKLVFDVRRLPPEQ